MTQYTKYISEITRRVNESGGYREYSVMNDNPEFRATGTWNDEHKVIEVLGSSKDRYGQRNGFDYDLVTHRFC